MATSVLPLSQHRKGLVLQLLFVVLGVAVMTLAAKTQIPFWPVPMTLHTMAVMGFAALLGPRLALSILLAYLAAGAAGLPVFSGTPERGLGLAYMTGPTGGYLLGFLLATGLVGRLAEGRGWLARFAVMMLGLALVYACGAAWLAAFMPLDRLWALGVAPFLAGDVLKVALVALAGHALSLRRRSDLGGAR